MSRLLRGLLWTVVSIVLVIAILAAIFIPVTVRRSFPQVSGAIHLAGLDGSVDIFRDSYGIPHIYAASQHDLFFAQGYVHAQDRFWQMDFWRHIGSGNLSEMFGESQLDTDKFLRTLGWARIAQQELSQYDPDTMAIMQAYSDGVNAYLADHQGSALSLEYAVLKLLTPSYKPAPWQPVNSLTWGKVMAWDLGGNLDDEIARAILLKTLTPQQVADLYPPFPSDHPVIVPSANASLASAASELNPMLADNSLDQAFERIQGRLDALKGLLGPAGAGIGSNSWAISGRLSATGKPLLANDPHLSAQMPSIWYEVGLHCSPNGPDCPYDLDGFSFAGTPGVVIGHNDRIAWGFTNVGMDTEDLYIEKINPDNPNQYEVNGQWVDMQIVDETLQVGGGQPVPLTVRYTRHGPIISDTYGDLKDFDQNAGVSLPQKTAIALRWTALEPSLIFSAILQINRAQNWDDFRHAAQSFTIAGQNMLYADVDGNIGYQMPGNVPVRASGDGSLPVPGWTDEHEWTGYIPFDQHPYSYNPPEGFIATANNAVVGPDYPYLLTKDWDYGFRARRIVDMIQGAPGPIDIAYIQKMQGDDKDLNTKALLPVLAALPPQDNGMEQARQLLATWDDQASMDSPAAALFEAFWKHLLADTFDDDLPGNYWPYGGDRWYEVMRLLVQQPQSSWWDVQGTPEIETRDQIIDQAFGEAVSELETRLGKNPDNWKWGDLHQLVFRNQSLGESGVAPIEAIFNRGPFDTSGSASIVNATSWEATSSYDVTTLPSMRMIVDLGGLQNSQTVITTGQSGHAYQPHYIDQADLWRNIQYHAMLWDKNEIETQAEAHLQLMP
jgi:penicillin amidase